MNDTIALSEDQRFDVEAVVDRGRVDIGVERIGGSRGVGAGDIDFGDTCLQWGCCIGCHILWVSG